MAWPPPQLPQSEPVLGRGPQWLSLAGWGLAAILCFAVAAMTYQFSGITETVDTAGATTDRSAGTPRADEAGPGIGIIKMGSDVNRNTEIARLSADIAQLRQDLIALRRTVSTVSQSRDQLAERIARIELTEGLMTSSIAKGDRGRAIAASTDVRARTATGGSDASGTPPMPPVPVAAREAREGEAAQQPARADPVVTGSLPPGDGQTERSDFAVDLGGYATLAALSKDWAAIRQRQKALLGDLAPRASLSDVNGDLEVRLVAGPFSNAAHAITMCAQLQARNQACQPTLFVGQPLGEP